MKRSWKVLFMLAVVVSSTVQGRGSIYAHDVTSGQARAQLVDSTAERYGVFGVIERATPQLRSANSFSWMMVSLMGGTTDCHTDETGATIIEVVRIGWMRWIPWSSGTVTYGAAAWIDSSNNTQVRQGTEVNTTTGYQVENLAGRVWSFSSPYIYATAWFGPYTSELICVTAGGWARSTQDAIGIAAISDVQAKSSSGIWYLQLYSQVHKVTKSPYYAAYITSVKYQYGGNN